MTAPLLSSTALKPSGEPRGLGRGLRGLGLYLGLWTLVALVMISMHLPLYPKELHTEAVLSIVGIFLVRNYGWALVSLLTLALVRAVPLHHKPPPRAWGIHLAASVLITLVGIVVMAIEIPLFYAPRLCFLPLVVTLAKQHFHFSYLVYYWGVVGVHESVQLFRHFQEQQRAAHELQAKFTQAQLQALRMQLTPHFLFNTLNAVAALMHSDPGRADKVLLKLSELLRMSLNRSTEQELTLNQELGFIESYLDIERLRFGDRLKIDIQVPPALLEAIVPTFLLQPLVENAIKHGVAPRASGACITIRASLENAFLRLEVEDDGPGRHPGGAGLGQSLLNVKSRLQQLYGQAQSFDLLFPLGGGALARINIPYSSIRDPQIRGGGTK
jgi:signal transduction histidine kinase